jgi:hypothetical protein
LIFSCTTFAQKQLLLKQIAEIKPMVTTENEIEKMFGKPVERHSEGGEYKTKYGYFYVVYSRGICIETSVMRYKVEKGVVLSLHFNAKKKIKFAQFGIDVSGWEKEVQNDFSPPTFHYFNLDKGISLWVRGGLLHVIQLYPSKAVDYLKCTE